MRLLDKQQRWLALSSRRWLATDAAAAAAANKKNIVAKLKRKRKRSHKSLALPRAPETTRERIRWLQDHNEVLVADNHYRTRAKIDRRIDDLGNTAEERLNYWRDKIFDFWRTGGTFSSVSPESTTAGGGRSAGATKNLRPAKQPLQMDAKWWFWNVAFALLPATLLTAYFELVAKPEMMEYNRIVHILKQRHLLGDTYNEEEDEELARLMEESSQTVASRIYNAVRELSLYFYWGQVVVSEEENSLPPSSPTLAVTRKQSGTRTTALKKHNHVTVNPKKKDDIVVVEEEAAITELRNKLQDLEMRLNEKQPVDNSIVSKQPTPSDSASAGSRIHARVMQQRGGEEVSQQPQKRPTRNVWERFSNVASQYLMGGKSSSSSSSPQEESLQVEDNQNQSSPINKNSPDRGGQHNAMATGAQAIAQPMQQSESPGPVRGNASESHENGDEDKDLSSRKPNGNTKENNGWWNRLWPNSG